MTARLPRHLAAALALAMGIGTLGAFAAPPAPTEAATSVTGTGLQLLARLGTASEHYWGYSRTYFIHWIDADGDGCDTRREVLVAESTTAVTIRSGCDIRGGTWFSVYDGKTTRDASTFDIDHVVALKEAWDSGAWSWTASRRQRYANDLGDGRALRAVSAASNRSKSDQDPAQWLPSRAAFRCTYAGQWVAMKLRWNLKVNTAERSALKRILNACPSTKLTVAIVP